MPPRKTSLTKREVQAFLKALEGWWSELSEDVGAVKKLLRKVEAGKAMSSEVEEKLKVLVGNLAIRVQCAYPPSIRKPRPK
jgi:hypothetical protein